MSASSNSSGTDVIICKIPSVEAKPLKREKFEIDKHNFEMACIG